MGRSSDLSKRDHFNAKHSGFYTLRRSLGAILKTTLGLTAVPRASGPSATNYKCFRFTEDGEERLTEWMRSNLKLSTCPYDGNIGQMEKCLICEAEPPLNLTNWPNPQKRKIMGLRGLCRLHSYKRRLPACDFRQNGPGALGIYSQGASVQPDPSLL